MSIDINNYLKQLADQTRLRSLILLRQEGELCVCVVTLAPGITGLLPKSKFNLAEKPGHLEQLKPGESLSVSVAEINAGDRKITLAPGDAAEEGGWKDYSQNTKAEPMSDLAIKLQALMDSKE